MSGNVIAMTTLTNDVTGVKRMCQVKLTASDTAQPDGAGGRIGRRWRLLTFDLHFGHASHVSLRVGGAAGVLSRCLGARWLQR